MLYENCSVEIQAALKVEVVAKKGNRGLWYDDIRDLLTD